jgi:hypothetical protein
MAAISSSADLSKKRKLGQDVPSSFDERFSKLKQRLEQRRVRILFDSENKPGLSVDLAIEVLSDDSPVIKTALLFESGIDAARGGVGGGGGGGSGNGGGGGGGCEKAQGGAGEKAEGGGGENGKNQDQNQKDEDRLVQAVTAKYQEVAVSTLCPSLDPSTMCDYLELLTSVSPNKLDVAEPKMLWAAWKYLESKMAREALSYRLSECLNMPHELAVEIFESMLNPRSFGRELLEPDFFTAFCRYWIKYDGKLSHNTAGYPKTLQTVSTALFYVVGCLLLNKMAALRKPLTSGPQKNKKRLPIFLQWFIDWTKTESTSKLYILSGIQATLGTEKSLVLSLLLKRYRWYDKLLNVEKELTIEKKPASANADPSPAIVLNAEFLQKHCYLNTVMFDALL